MDSELIFLKLGGSLLTDKTVAEALRTDVLDRLATEIARTRHEKPGLRLLLGHGSGSFGHVAAAQYGTRRGVSGAEGWHGYAIVSDAAARLNRAVVAALLRAGVPAVSLSPSASAVCADGRLLSLATEPVRMALAGGLVPVVYGDVAFDRTQGGTIVSTEEVMTYLAAAFHPTWLLLAGETQGVLDLEGQVVPLITADSLSAVLPALGGSRGTDVTGGMRAKVQGMLDLAAAANGLSVRIFSGLEPGALHDLLINPHHAIGTLLR